MPLVGSGIFHEAESVFGDPDTMLRAKFLGADGTKSDFFFFYIVNCVSIQGGTGGRGKGSHMGVYIQYIHTHVGLTRILQGITKW